MTDGSAEPGRAELDRLLELAIEHVCDLSAGRKTWRMSIPAQGDDSDLILIDALNHARAALHAATAPQETDTVEVIVNGQPVVVKVGTVRNVIRQAIQQSGQIGAPVAQWELRTTEGDVIPHNLTDGTDYELTPGRRLWLNLGVPATAPQEGRLAAAPEIELVDYYGCVACQKYHHQGEALFDEHVMRQDKHGIRRWPKSCFDGPAAPQVAQEGQP